MPDGTPFAFTAPSVGHYPWQFYWDSCFTAITWRHFEPERSRRELESLLAAQRPDGFIGHTIFWDRPLTGARRFTYNVVSRNASMTSSIQPPALAWAWRLAIGDPAAEPRITRHHEWLAEHRNLDGDGLLWIVQPDESGLDASPAIRPDLAPSRTRAARVRPPGGAQPAARLRPCRDRPRRWTGRLRGDDQRAVQPLAPRPRAAVADPDPDRPLL